LRPAVDGLGDEVMVRLPDGHGVAVQQVPDVQHVADVQHVPDVQQVAEGQHAPDGQQAGLDTGQQTVVVCAPVAGAFVGIGQHGWICGQ
jgi:hypothetical protein